MLLMHALHGMKIALMSSKGLQIMLNEGARCKAFSNTWSWLPLVFIFTSYIISKFYII